MFRKKKSFIRLSWDISKRVFIYSRVIMREDLYFHGVKALIKNSEWKYLLLRVNTSWRYEYKGWDYRDVPWWRVEKWMDIRSTLLREVKEETSIENVSIWKHLWTSLSAIRITLPEGNFGLFLSMYECQIPHDAQIILSNEHVEYNRFDWEEVKTLLSVKYNSEFLASLSK